MTARQHAPLIHVRVAGQSSTLRPVALQARSTIGGYDEAWIRDLIFAHPDAIPIQEIDPSFGPLIPVCTELDTRGAGYADAIFINHLGMPTIVECKLWRNPEARREVVGQILDYARALKRWTYSELRREVARARRSQGFDLVSHIREVSGFDLDEAAFVDNVSRNLERGRVLLLVVGDGIREGVEAIAEYLQGSMGSQFTFGLVEAQVFELGEGERIIQPRVLARTFNIARTVVDYGAEPVSEAPPPSIETKTAATIQEPDERQRWMLAFWTELLGRLKLDDSEQPQAKPLAESNIFFPLPTRGSMWLTAYFISQKNEAGVFVGYNRTSTAAVEVISYLETIRDEIDTEFESIGIELKWAPMTNGKIQIGASKPFPPIRDDRHREDELEWFNRAINGFVNVFRPRIAGKWAEITSEQR